MVEIWPAKMAAADSRGLIDQPDAFLLEVGKGSFEVVHFAP